MASKESDPNGKTAKEPGAKLDQGKPCVYRGCVGYFPRAMEAVAALSTAGAAKYSWGGWETVPDGFDRYSDALVRHLIQEGKGEILDNDTGLSHSTAVAWNALARLELFLREQEQPQLWAASEEADEIVKQINESYYLQPREEDDLEEHFREYERYSFHLGGG